MFNYGVSLGSMFVSLWIGGHLRLCLEVLMGVLGIMPDQGFVPLSCPQLWTWFEANVVWTLLDALRCLVSNRGWALITALFCGMWSLSMWLFLWVFDCFGRTLWRMQHHPWVMHILCDQKEESLWKFINSHWKRHYIIMKSILYVNGKNKLK